MGHIIFYRGYPLPGNLIPVRAAALFLDMDQPPFQVHIVEIYVSDCRPTHAGFGLPGITLDAAVLRHEARAGANGGAVGESA